ncbi:MAG: hypothetical protein Q8M47_02840 [Devosia sp.]|jgi:hypothetical protein|nr:hypothetical protein [Devosia sp.]
MLAELAVYAASYRRTPPAFRPHLRPAIGYWARGARQARAWAPHLANTRGLLDTTIDDHPVRRTVVVLGSGALFDLPLESLARTFEHVLLVDRVHLSSIDARIARYSNVRLAWRDLSTAADPAALDFLRDIEGLDWVISANVLSAMASAAEPAMARRVVDSHLGSLAALPCPVTLITDLDYRVLNRHGVIVDSADLLHGYPMPRSGLRWKWEVAPFREEARDTRRVHYVAAWPDWRMAEL